MVRSEPGVGALSGGGESLHEGGTLSLERLVGAFGQFRGRGFGGLRATAVVGGVTGLSTQHAAGRLRAQCAVFWTGAVRGAVVTKTLNASWFAKAVSLGVTI